MSETLTAQHPLDHAVRLEAVEPGLYRGATTPEYWNMAGPFGGATAAVMLKAVLDHPERRGRTRLFRAADRRLLLEILRGRRIGFTISEIREIIQVYKDPPGEIGQLQLLMQKVVEKRDDLRQKRRDIDETLAELDNVEEACLTRLAEIGVGT